MWWHQWIVLLYTSLNTAVISHKPLKNVFSIYSNSDRIDLIYLGWGKTPPRSILGAFVFLDRGGVEPLHTYLLPARVGREAPGDERTDAPEEPASSTKELVPLNTTHRFSPA